MSTNLANRANYLTMHQPSGNRTNNLVKSVAPLAEQLQRATWILAQVAVALDRQAMQTRQQGRVVVAYVMALPRIGQAQIHETVLAGATRAYLMAVPLAELVLDARPRWTVRVVQPAVARCRAEVRVKCHGPEGATAVVFDVRKWV